MAIDEVQQIAGARATMLMRGYSPLRCDIGRQFVESLLPKFPAMAAADFVEHLEASIGMKFCICDDMEGFAVVPVD